MGNKQSMFTPYCQFFFCQVVHPSHLGFESLIAIIQLSIRLSNFGRGLMIQLLFFMPSSQGTLVTRNK